MLISRFREVAFFIGSLWFLSWVGVSTKKDWLAGWPFSGRQDGEWLFLAETADIKQ